MNKEIKNFKVKIIKERFAKEDFKIYKKDRIYTMCYFGRFLK